MKQLTCPNCRYEFHYDNGYYDDNITRLGVEIKDIIVQLSAYKTLPRDQQRMSADWRNRARKALSEKQKEIAELKAIRKLGDQQIKRLEYELFKQAVKDRYGEDAYRKCLDEVVKGVEAYKLSDLAKTPYSRHGAGVVSIAKL